MHGGDGHLLHQACTEGCHTLADGRADLLPLCLWQGGQHHIDGGARRQAAEVNPQPAGGRAKALRGLCRIRQHLLQPRDGHQGRTHDAPQLGLTLRGNVLEHIDRRIAQHRVAIDVLGRLGRAGLHQLVTLQHQVALLRGHEGGDPVHLHLAKRLWHGALDAVLLDAGGHNA